MSTHELERDLERLRACLRAATAADLRRHGRRRRLAARAAVVPVLALAGGGVAVAVDPPWGDPAPPAVQQQFDQTMGRVGGDGGRLSVWARDGDQVLYGTSSADGHRCVALVDSMATLGSCRQVPGRPEPGRIDMLMLGGATDRAGNVAAGEVSAPGAETVSISSPGEPSPTVVAVGHDGYFVAQLPDSTLARPGERPAPPALTVVARDAAGTVVARAPAGG